MTSSSRAFDGPPACADYSGKLHESWSLRGSADYQLVVVTLRSPARTTVNASVATAELAAAWAMTARWHLELNGRAVRLPVDVVLSPRILRKVAAGSP